MLVHQVQPNPPVSQPSSPVLDAPSDSVAMSPDAVLAYCESQMQGFNSDFNQFVQGAQTSAALKNTVTTLQTDMSSIPAAGLNCSNPGPGENATDQATFSKINGDLTAAIAQAQQGGNIELAQQLQGIQQTFNQGGSPGTTDNIVLPSEVTSMSSSLTSASSDIDANSQIQMISLQSVMSQQASVLQMSTGIIQQMGETQEKIAGNV